MLGMLIRRLFSAKRQAPRHHHECAETACRAAEEQAKIEAVRERLNRAEQELYGHHILADRRRAPRT